MKIKSEQGFTLIEILIATGIVTLVMTGISSGVSFAVKNARFSQEKAVSVKHAQESIEWLRAQRDVLGWTAFYQILTDEQDQHITYCLTEIPDSVDKFVELRQSKPEQSQGQSDSPLDCAPIADSLYTRKLQLTLQDPQTIRVESEVVWDSTSQQNSTVLTTDLRKW